MLEMILQSLSKRKKKFVLIFLQFIVGFSALFFGMMMVDNSMEYERMAARLAPLETIHAFVPDDEYIDVKKLEILQEELQKLSVVRQAGAFQNIVIGEDENGENGIPLLAMDCELFELENIRLTIGDIEELKTYDGKGKVIPVVISPGLEDRYKVGETYPIETFEEEIQGYSMKIVGVLKPDMKFWQGGSSDIVNSIKKDSENILAPRFYSYTSDLPIMSNLLIEKEASVSLEKAKESIEGVYDKQGISVDLKTIQEEVDEHTKMFMPVILVSLCFAGILIFLSILGCVGTLLSMLLTRKEEFGVYFSLGITRGKLMQLIFGEVLITFLAGFSIAFAITFAVVQLFMAEDGFSISLYTFGSVLGLVVFFAVLCILLPIWKLMRMKPVELLNERIQK